MRAMLAGVLLAVTGCVRRAPGERRTPCPVRVPLSRFASRTTTTAPSTSVVTQGTDMFLKQVAANSTEDLPVANVAEGTQVRLKATRTDGSKTYTSDPMALNAATTWKVP